LADPIKRLSMVQAGGICKPPPCKACAMPPSAPSSDRMRQASHRLQIATGGRGLVEITGAVASWVAAQGIVNGLATLFCRHTSASLLIQENADPDVRADLETFFRKLAPEERGRHLHEEEGPDDMPAHIRAALTQSQLSIPVENGRLALGTWQGIYLFEHRHAPRRREIALHLIGE
jgi:secondary thiamine-phosphate synthase enzyme